MDLNLTMQNLENNGINSFYVDTKSQALKKAQEFLKPGDSVAMGGSTTISECGVIDMLKNGNYQFYNQFCDEMTPSDLQTIYENAYRSDVYFTSSNAVTENGELYNVDGRANRISAIAFGPRVVIMIVSTNKIVKNLDEAINRVKTICAPMNCARLNMNTYCNAKGSCESLNKEFPAMSDGCSGPDRICCNFLVSAKQRVAGRIKVIFVGEQCGY